MTFKRATWLLQNGHVARFLLDSANHAFRSSVLYKGKPLNVIAIVRALAQFSMKRIAAFSLATWSAAALLYFGQHSVALMALSGIIVFGGFDLLAP